MRLVLWAFIRIRIIHVGYELNYIHRILWTDGWENDHMANVTVVWHFFYLYSYCLSLISLLITYIRSACTRVLLSCTHHHLLQFTKNAFIVIHCHYKQVIILDVFWFYCCQLLCLLVVINDAITITRYQDTNSHSYSNYLALFCTQCSVVRAM